MADQITKPARIARRYYKSTCCSWCILGLVCIVLCIWVTVTSSAYQDNPQTFQMVLSPTASLDTLSYKHLYSVHQPARLVIHVGNTPSSLTIQVSTSKVGAPLHPPAHFHSSTLTPLPTPQHVRAGISPNAKTSLAPLAKITPEARSFSLPPTATPTSIPTPITSLSTIPQQSAHIPLHSTKPVPTTTPIPTIDIQATPIQGYATPEAIPTKNAALQFPEPETPVVGHEKIVGKMHFARNK